MRRIISNFISVMYSLVKFSIIKLFQWKTLSFYVIERFSPNVVTEFNKESKVTIGKRVRVHSGSKIKVRRDGNLRIGDDVRFNYNCVIVCRDRIEIGEGTEFGPSVYIYDHDHVYRERLQENSFICEPISIGRNCWIGANCVLLRGTELGDNCVVGAGSVLKGKHKTDSVIIQKRATTVYDSSKCECKRNSVIRCDK